MGSALAPPGQVRAQAGPGHVRVMGGALAPPSQVRAQAGPGHSWVMGGALAPPGQVRAQAGPGHAWVMGGALRSSRPSQSPGRARPRVGDGRCPPLLLAKSEPRQGQAMRG